MNHTQTSQINNLQKNVSQNITTLKVSIKQSTFNKVSILRFCNSVSQSRQLLVGCPVIRRCWIGACLVNTSLKAMKFLYFKLLMNHS